MYCSWLSAITRPYNAPLWLDHQRALHRSYHYHCYHDKWFIVFWNSSISWDNTPHHCSTRGGPHHRHQVRKTDTLQVTRSYQPVFPCSWLPVSGFINSRENRRKVHYTTYPWWVEYWQVCSLVTWIMSNNGTWQDMIYPSLYQPVSPALQTPGMQTQIALVSPQPAKICQTQLHEKQ